ncbi:MAG: baseplate wedge protein 53 [Methylophagaceae bacterium]|jgi:hypothetical protein|tara:strand:- start:1252 stop:1554 length:303 start_codon:yes stop_codon:yes gene_type:complete
MAKYTTSSPWANTKIEGEEYLGILKIRPVPKESDDVLYTIQPQYTHRPDLLAYDVYGDSKLWWVFAQRNMDVIKDPIYDMIAGTEIYLPQDSKLKKLLGV